MAVNHNGNQRRVLLKTAIAGSAAALIPQFARAQGAATSILVGYPAGGATDAAARIIANGLRNQLDEPFIVENKAGAGGRVATDQLRHAKPDGRTLMFTIPSPLVLHPHLYRNVPYDPLTDFATIGMVARLKICLSVGPGVPDSVRTLADYVAWVRGKPDGALFGAVTGNSPHFAGLLLAREAKLNLRLAPYKGGAQLITDLVGGHVSTAITPLAEALPLQQSGRIRILAVISASRSQLAPAVPTMAELGYPSLRLDSWVGLIGPAAMPPATIERLAAALQVVVSHKGVPEAISKLSMEPEFTGPEGMRKVLHEDYAFYRDAVKSTGVRVED